MICTNAANVYHISQLVTGGLVVFLPPVLLVYSLQDVPTTAIPVLAMLGRGDRRAGRRPVVA